MGGSHVLGTLTTGQKPRGYCYDSPGFLTLMVEGLDAIAVGEGVELFDGFGLVIEDCYATAKLGYGFGYGETYALCCKKQRRCQDICTWYFKNSGLVLSLTTTRNEEVLVLEAKAIGDFDLAEVLRRSHLFVLRIGCKSNSVLFPHL